LSLRLQRQQSRARRRRGYVNAPDADPDRDPPDAQAGKERGTAVNRALDRLPSLRRRSRYRRALAKAGSMMLGVVLLIWSLLPVYNMLLIALDPEEGEIEFTGNLWPP